MDIVDSNSMLYVHIYLRLKRRGREKCVCMCVCGVGVLEKEGRVWGEGTRMLLYVELHQQAQFSLFFCVVQVDWNNEIG